MPGVVLLDQALLFAGRLIADAAAAGWQVGNAKFFSPVGPGETLHFSLVRKNSGSIVFTIAGNGRDVASGSLTPPAA